MSDWNRSPFAEDQDEVETRPASVIEAKPLQWLWRGRIARGKVTVLAGHPGLGKSQLGLGIAAIVSAGGLWPLDDGRAIIGSTLILSAEDDAEDTIRPRLEAAGADLDRCHVAGSVVRSGKRGGFSLQEDLGRLAAKLDQLGDVSLIAIDPITAYLGSIDSHRNAEVRSVLSPVAELAARYQAAVLAVSHLRKSIEGDAILRVSGSLGIVAAARAVYLVMADPAGGERRLLLPAKNNLGTDRTGYGFQVVPHYLPGPGIATSRIEWADEAVTITADEALGAAATAGRPDNSRKEAAKWLFEMLADGPVAVSTLQAEAKGAGISWRTIERARADMPIAAGKVGFEDGKWHWSLTKDGQAQQTNWWNR